MIAGVGLLILLFVILPGLPDSFGLSGFAAILAGLVAIPLEIKIIDWICRQPPGKNSDSPDGHSAN